RLVNADDAKKWENRRHFFAAAAEAMRRILIENARRRKVRKLDLAGRAATVSVETPEPIPLDDVLDVHTALEKLDAHDVSAAEMVKLHYFAGLSIDEAAALLQIPRRSAYRKWEYARVWLYRSIATESCIDPLRQNDEAGRPTP